MSQQIPIGEEARGFDPERDKWRDDGTREIAPDLAYRRLALVNVVFWGVPGAGDREWVLIDAGVKGGARFIASAAAERFGPKSRPAAIVLTHAHFDHVGTLEHFAEEWDAPVWAHPLECPHLDGTKSYPPPDTSAGGGIMPLLAPLFPRGPLDLGARLHPLPEDGTVPPMPGWRWIHTPGHTEGHVSFWRDADGTLIVGDAFVTTAQESAYAVAVQEPELHGPPAYFTPDWASARISVAKLAKLEPERVVTGHGQALKGPLMREALHLLARDFDRVAVPESRRAEQTYPKGA
jgi:glyoxylase-like metal-dependent hydrolase (beta-lactamase superfamily II)